MIEDFFSTLVYTLEGGYKFMKNLGIIVTIVLAIIGGAIAYGTLQNKANRVDKVEIEVKEVERRLDENEKIDIRQSVIQERTVRILDKIEQKL